MRKLTKTLGVKVQVEQLTHPGGELWGSDLRFLGMGSNVIVWNQRVLSYLLLLLGLALALSSWSSSSSKDKCCVTFVRYAQRIQFFLRDSVLLLILFVQRHQRSICIVVRVRVAVMMLVDVVSSRVRCANDFAYFFSFFFAPLPPRHYQASFSLSLSRSRSPFLPCSLARFFLFSSLSFSLSLSFFLRVCDCVCAVTPMNRWPCTYCSSNSNADGSERERTNAHSYHHCFAAFLSFFLSFFEFFFASFSRRALSVHLYVHRCVHYGTALS